MVGVIDKIKRVLPGGLPAQPCELALIAVLLAVVPVFSQGFFVAVVFKAVLMAILAISLDLAWGYSGILNFGTAGFFGVGGYGLAIFTKYYAGAGALPSGFLIGVAAACTLAVLVSVFVFWAKVTPFYIAIVTIAVGFLCQQMALRFTSVTGGANGLTKVMRLPGGVTGRYYIVLGVFVVVCAGVYILGRSNFGRVMKAVMENEQRLRFLGYNTPVLRSVVLCASCCIAGFAGALYASTQGFVSPNLLSIAMSTQVIVWVAIGGRGKVVGAVAGALAINILSPYLMHSYAYIWQIFIGAMFIAAVMFVPNGLYSLLHPGHRRRVRTYSMFSEEGAAAATESREVLNVENVRLAFGTLDILKGVNFKLFSRELHCLIGPNGAGKTTVINVITGLLWPSSGRVMRDGVQVSRRSPEKTVALGVVRTFQSTVVFNGLDVGEGLQLAAWGGRWPSWWRLTSRVRCSASAAELLRASHLDTLLSERAGDLSHGQQKLLELVMATQSAPTVLLLDEPTAGLSSVERKEIGQVLRYLVEEKGVAILIIEHDMDFVRSIADRVTVLSNGIVVADGSVQEVTNSDVVRRVYLGGCEIDEQPAY